MLVDQMLKAHPNAQDSAELRECLEACLECAFTCTSCADACLNEQSVQNLRECIRRNLDCAEICQATAWILTRSRLDDNLTRAILVACVEACVTCGAECAEHAEMHEHCRICAQACRRCEQACRDLLGTFNLTG